MAEIKNRERDAVLQSLQAGLVPKLGLHLIQVGRKLETESMLKDMDRIADGGATFRLVIGRFGSGKSFFLNLVRTLALQKKLVVVQADMSMEKRIFASRGEARALYSEFMRNLSIKSRPNGGALRNLCEGWISTIHHDVTNSGGNEDDVKKRIATDLRDLSDLVGGYDFAHVLTKYYEGYISGDDILQDNALRWIRGEYRLKTEARELLGVRRIVDDVNIYESLKLMAAFCRKAGYGGLLVNIDEMVVLSHRLPSKRAREGNFEALLTILNDCLQGSASGLGFLLAGTDEFLQDERRGLFSYEALRSRLQPNTLVGPDVVDLSGPVVKLPNLTPEELYVLLQNIRHIQALGDPDKYLVPDDGLHAVFSRANHTMGAEFFKTPRDIIRSFVNLLNVLEQNPGRQWSEFINNAFISTSQKPQSIEEEEAFGIRGNNDQFEDDVDDNLAEFRL